MVAVPARPPSARRLASSSASCGSGKDRAYQGLQRWHHISGLIFAPFLLAWIFSGFLSMDDGTLFAHSDALFRALHKLDFPPLASHPWLRTGVIVALCLCGLAFSLTGVVLAWRRVRIGAKEKV